MSGDIQSQAPIKNTSAPTEPQSKNCMMKIVMAIAVIVIIFIAGTAFVFMTTSHELVGKWGQISRMTTDTETQVTTWENDTGYWELFRDDFTGTSSAGGDFIWATEDGKLQITNSAMGGPVITRFNYNLDGNTLTITGPVDVDSRVHVVVTYQRM